ncbi:hypothetical protein KY284_033561 [Solanum tuberosum]|nr:hypothetical protein KY284_033561 [Solanum tuberosum]
MKFYSVNGLNSLLIDSKKLKSLILKDPQNDTGNLRDLQCRLLDVSALATAKLTFTVVCGLELRFKIPDCHKYHETFITLIQQNIGKLRVAKEITMGAWFFEAPCMLQQFKELPDLDLKWTHLTLDLFLDYFNVNSIADLIGAATCIETLNINIKTCRCSITTSVPRPPQNRVQVGTERRLGRKKANARGTPFVTETDSASSQLPPLSCHKRPYSSALFAAATGANRRPATSFAVYSDPTTGAQVFNPDTSSEKILHGPTKLKSDSPTNIDIGFKPCGLK